MGAAYDNYKFTEATLLVSDHAADEDEFIEPQLGLSNQQIADRIESLDHEINWLIGRLGNLVMSDEDRAQTEDFIMDLRQERESLKRCFNAS